MLKIKNGIKLKVFFTCFFMVFIFKGCSMDDSNGVQKKLVIEEALRLSEDNMAFYIGGAGLVCENFYILRKDKTNRLVNGTGEILYLGNELDEINIVRIDLKKSKNVEDISHLGIEEWTDVVVVFAKDKVYILDFLQERYCFYERSFD